MKKVMKFIGFCIVFLIPFLTVAEKPITKPVCTTVVVDMGFGIIPIYQVITECTDGKLTVTVVKWQLGAN